MRNLIVIAAALALFGTMASAEITNAPSVSGTPPGVPNPPPGAGPSAGPPPSELPIPPSAQPGINVPNGPGSAGTSSNPALNNNSPTANGNGIDPTKGVYAKDKSATPSTSGSSGSSSASPTKKNINGDIDGDTGARGAAK